MKRGTAIPILVYHSIDVSCAAAYRRWMILPQEFENHLHMLADAGYRAVTVSALASAMRNGGDIPARTVAITFDDGLSDFATGALPLLRRFGFEATLYVVSGLVGKTGAWLSSLGEGLRPMLGWQELRDIASSGIEIGAHTTSHPELDILPRARAADEIADSKICLEDGIDRPVNSFAYPHGYSSRTTRDLVRRAGFTSACRVRHALASTTEDPFALSRIVVTSEIGPSWLRHLMEGPALPVGPPADRLVSSAWRLVRRVTHGRTVQEHAKASRAAERRTPEAA